jgi:O-antigen ligase
MPSLYRLFRLSFISLPYLFYISFVGVATVMVGLRWQFGRTGLDPLVRNSLIAIAGLLILSSFFAARPDEAFLQLANWLPYFFLFAVLPFLLQKTERLAQLATDIVLAAIPINLLAAVEFGLRSSTLPRWLRQIDWIAWVRSRPHAGRAMVMFTHPNSLANYLVLVLGLGLGLIGYEILRQRSGEVKGDRRIWLVLLSAATYLNLVGIFCSGSRNGLAVAILQIVIFSFCSRTKWIVGLTGLLGGLGILIGATQWGIGGRSLSSIGDWIHDPRFRAWGIAVDLIRERPLLGWGLGNYKFQFPERLVAAYPECIADRATPQAIAVACADVAHPHNFWLLVGSEAGLIALMAIVAFAGYLCFRSVWRLLQTKSTIPERAILLAYLLAFLGCIAFACFDVTFYDARLNVMNWLILAGLYCLATDGGAKSETKHLY